MKSTLFTELTLTEQENLSGGLADIQLGLNIALPVQTAVAVNAANLAGRDNNGGASASNYSDIYQNVSNRIRRRNTIA